MTSPVSISFVRVALALAALIVTWGNAGASSLRIDFDSSSDTQASWESLASSDADRGDSWSKDFPGGIGIDVDAAGAVTLDSRDRGAANGGGAESGMWRDFLFANGSFDSAAGSGLSINITGLAANTVYPIRIWGWDESSNGGRRADWSGGGAGPVTLEFPDSPNPASLADYVVLLEAMTDPSGSVTLMGIVAANIPSTSHNVFVNGLEIGDPASAGEPVDISLSNAIVATTAPAGTLVGILTSADPTPGDTFSYALVGGSGSSNNADFAIDGDQLSTDRDLSGYPDGTMLAIRIRTTDADGGSFEKPFSIGLANALLPLRLNEILTRNDTGIADGDGNREDWIEIYNPNGSAVNLDGYFLTDDPFLLTQWNFPNISIGANGYLLVFASGKDFIDGGGNPHANFQLGSGGGFLAIVRPNGSTIDDSFSPSFPAQFRDISYGVPNSGGEPVFYQARTPGAVNSPAAYPGVVRDTRFSADRGFYNAPFQVAIASATPGAMIRFTTDGSKPSATSGTIYSGPIEITTTTTLRAIASFGSWLPTNVDTHTYIFVDDVVAQPSDPPGWPATWGYDSQVDSNDGAGPGIVPSDYEMDARVVSNANGLGVYSVQEALLDIPTVAISMSGDEFVGQSNGIYTHPISRWERVCSVEYIHPDGTPGFQEDCKIEIHGNSSRTPWRMQKHSMRLTFSSSVGAPKLHYPLFPGSPVEDFNKLVLRACFTDSWALNSWSPGRYRPNDSQYIRDVWMKDSLAAMGQPSSYGNFVHVYVNGLYFGLHNLTERLEDDFFADHLGGDRDDWQINADLSGAPARWNSMVGILNGNIADNSVYDAVKPYIDLEDYADYMLLHFYADAEDWPHHNGYAAANSNSGDGKFRFFVWDQEIVLDKFSWDRYSVSTGGGQPFQRLRQNGEFRMLFADRVQKHMFNGGAISEQASVDRYMARADEIDKAIVAESARWGDVQASTPYGNTASSSTDIDADYYPPLINNPLYFTREQHWVVERDNVVGHYIPTLHDASDSRGIINELRSNNLFPSIDAPVFSQHGGPVADNFDLGITASGGDIYYTTDGTDPRLVGGAINPDATMLAGGTLIDGLVTFEEAGWRYLDTGAPQSDSQVVAGHPSYGSADWKHPGYDDAAWGTGQAMLGYGGIGTGADIVPVHTTVGYGPSSFDRYPTTYFRKPFSVTGAADYTGLTVSVIRDDGAIVYLNGKEVGRTNLGAGNRTYSDNAASASPEHEVVDLPAFTLSPGDLLEGINLLAIEVHQQSAGSSDLGIDAKVSAARPNDGGASGATLAETGRVIARALNNGEWSAATEASFIVGTPASSANLVVSEILYNPPGSLEDTEFIELMNSSATETIDLTHVALTGIHYMFPDGYVLDPHERVVIVKDQLAFAAAYSTVGMRIAPGDFGSTSLANGGEEIAIIAQDGATDIQRFTYDDASPWPESPDGPGFSLVLIAPWTTPDHTLARNWRASTAVGGTPGASDASLFSGDPDVDADRDAIVAFLEYAMGTSDSASSSAQLPQGGTGAFDPGTGTTSRYLTLAFQRNLAADDVVYDVQVGGGLAAWSSDTAFVSSTNNGDGTATEVYRSKTPISASSREFMRLKVTAR